MKFSYDVLSVECPRCIGLMWMTFYQIWQILWRKIQKYYDITKYYFSCKVYVCVYIYVYPYYLFVVVWLCFCAWEFILQWQQAVTFVAPVAEVCRREPLVHNSGQLLRLTSLVASWILDVFCWLPLEKNPINLANRFGRRRLIMLFISALNFGNLKTKLNS